LDARFGTGRDLGVVAALAVAAVEILSLQFRANLLLGFASSQQEEEEDGAKTSGGCYWYDGVSPPLLL